MQLTPWMEYYLETVRRIGEKAANTADDLTYLCEYLILPELGKVRVEHLTAERLESWRDARLKEYAPSVVKRACQLLKKALADLVERGALKRNPAYGLADFAAPTQQPEYFTPEETRLFVAVCPSYRVGLVAFCAVRLGLRIGEALALRWADYNSTARTISIVRQALDQPGRPFGEPKRGSRRILPVPPDLAAVLDAAYPSQSPFNLICPVEGERDIPITHRNARRALASMLKAASLPAIFTWHSLRHTLGARLTELGASEAIIAAILGHKGGSVTARYSHANTADPRYTLEAVEALRPWVEAAARRGGAGVQTGT